MFRTTMPNIIGRCIKRVKRDRYRKFTFCRENDKYRVDRLSQALEGGDFINMTSNDADAVIYCGDFNSEPGDLPHKILTQYYGLHDCHESATEKLFTCFALENTYRECDRDKNPRAKIIDYVMYKSYFETKVNSLLSLQSRDLLMPLL